MTKAIIDHEAMRDIAADLRSGEKNYWTNEEANSNAELIEALVSNAEQEAN